MDEDTFAQLSAMSQNLQKRALALSHQGKEADLAMLMSAQALTMEAVKSLGEALNRIRPRRLEAAILAKLKNGSGITSSGPLRRPH
ncbi:hypothetical protein [Neorhizobium galegae]|nr:hypothetical protein [Neorhizobium galegae]